MLPIRLCERQQGQLDSRRKGLPIGAQQSLAPCPDSNRFEASLFGKADQPVSWRCLLEFGLEACEGLLGLGLMTLSTSGHAQSQNGECLGIRKW